MTLKIKGITEFGNRKIYKGEVLDYKLGLAIKIQNFINHFLQNKLN